MIHGSHIFVVIITKVGMNIRTFNNSYFVLCEKCEYSRLPILK